MLYACAEGADRLEKQLDLYSVDYNDRHEYRRAFGDPARMAELPLTVVLQEGRRTRGEAEARRRMVVGCEGVG